MTEAYDVWMGQAIRFCQSSDGVRIAYASCGSGPPVVRPAYYLGNLEYDPEPSPWNPYREELRRYCTLVCHDTRGCGLSDREFPEQGLDAWVRDLEAVVDAAGLERFTLFGTCHGGAVAIEYAVRHPERVSRMVLLGTYARGRAKRQPRDAQLEEVGARLIELGWGADESDAFRRIYMALFQPSAPFERYRALAAVQRKSCTAATALALLGAAAQTDVRESAAKVRCPTLVLHTTRNPMLPLEEGRLLATLIPGARFVALDSDNHLITELEPAWKEFAEEVRGFLDSTGAARDRVVSLHGLTPREADILERLAQGLDNAQIAAHLDMSEKTVRNHITRIFDKLGAESRAQAIVRAREAGLGMRPGAG
jgi:pimeloyl-ACP methyl ester carboxylesterase/DNA-binding CsgD family transcriptional regulator